MHKYNVIVERYLHITYLISQTLFYVLFKHSWTERERQGQEKKEKNTAINLKCPCQKKKLLDMIFLIFFPDFKYCLSIKNQCVKAF